MIESGLRGDAGISVSFSPLVLMELGGVKVVFRPRLGSFLGVFRDVGAPTGELDCPPLSVGPPRDLRVCLLPPALAQLGEAFALL